MTGFKRPQGRIIEQKNHRILAFTKRIWSNLTQGASGPQFSLPPSRPLSHGSARYYRSHPAVLHPRAFGPSHRPCYESSTPTGFPAGQANGNNINRRVGPWEAESRTELNVSLPPPLKNRDIGPTFRMTICLPGFP